MLAHDRPRPFNYHERTGHVLPAEDNLFQFYIRDTENFVEENRMVINKQKTKVINFSKSRKWDFPPEVFFSDGTPLEFMSEAKLVGVVVSRNLKWFKNTSYICEKARSKLWILRRMLKLDLNTHQMFDVYTKEVRSILEMTVPVWHSGLSKQQSADIESIQKMTMRIILGEDYVNLKVKIPSSLKLAQMFKPDKKVIKSGSSIVTLADARKVACLIWQNS